MLGKKGVIVLLLIILSIVNSGCAYKGIDIGTDAFFEGYSQAAGLQIKQVEFTGGSIEDQYDKTTKFSFGYTLNVKNEVIVDSVLGQYPKIFGKGPKIQISVNGISNYSQIEVEKTNLMGTNKLNPYVNGTFRASNTFSVPLEYFGDSGEIIVVNYFTEQTDSDPKIEQMRMGIKTTITYSKNHRDRKYEVDGVSEVITVKKSLININL